MKISTESESLESFTIADHDQRWPAIFAAERQALLACGCPLLLIEHFGSTAVPGLAAKPIIDLMAAVGSLGDEAAIVSPLLPRGYRVITTGMRNRLMLRRLLQEPGAVAIHLHIVEMATWETRKERIFRDYLLSHPESAGRYAELKRRLAREYAGDSLGYTRAKTNFIQEAMDRAWAERGLPSSSVWED
jgi:GrpB-like predicted nucleotidyltransferase (UPF0157 family)